MRSANMDRLGKCICDQTWKEAYESHPTVFKTNALYHTLHITCDKFFPIVTIQEHPNDKPWMTFHIKYLKNQWQRTFRHDRNNGLAKYDAEYREPSGKIRECFILY